MTAGQGPDRSLADLRAGIVRLAGGYLRNVVREPNVTCDTCTTPVAGYRWCWQCHQARQHHQAGLADLVVPLCYAVSTEQSGLVLRGYKDGRTESARARQTRVVTDLLAYGLIRHGPCIERAIGSPVEARIAVPSTGSSRRATHPLLTICDRIGATSPTLRMTAAANGSDRREVRDDLFSVNQRLTGAHVMVIDDTWTTGSRAQSAAIAMRRAGAAFVTVVVIARWLTATFGDTPAFLRSHPLGTYDPDICPVTGGSCP